ELRKGLFAYVLSLTCVTRHAIERDVLRIRYEEEEPCRTRGGPRPNRVDERGRCSDFVRHDEDARLCRCRGGWTGDGSRIDVDAVLLRDRQVDNHQQDRAEEQERRRRCAESEAT